MNKISILLIFFTLLISCQESNGTQGLKDPMGFLDIKDKYSDGDYCAEVNYYNSKTRTHSSYTLTIEVSNNEVIKINFPNGGYFDDEITDGTLDSTGKASFTSNKGYECEVKITGEAGDCFKNVAIAKQCNGTTKKGKQCKHKTDNLSGFCWQHEVQK